jgi:hypothetical protein
LISHPQNVSYVWTQELRSHMKRTDGHGKMWITDGTFFCDWLMRQPEYTKCWLE